MEADLALLSRFNLSRARWFMVLVVLISSILSGCSATDTVETEAVIPKIPAIDAIQIDEVQMRDISFVDDQTTFRGIQYDVILNTALSDKQLKEIGVGLQFSGEAQQVWGRSESGYSNGYSILERTDAGMKVLVSIDLLKDAVTDEELNKLKSEESLTDMEIKLFYQGAAYTTLLVNNL
ncbi:hypothetical protein PCCS19_05980 [Paenibacillus sp. CCS19]|uniref:hypothetical protein n=1 Tax=Paenibacillus sp. CCS19 TaxID=3158387 RepID=UPI0025668CC3|nr:hypothetical protein [Paenibacillus cellulosilyticus]GMK37544.1 hypothetical protein PCCS19_05980 [Paenibacillus cellulosilyticus]